MKSFKTLVEADPNTYLVVDALSLAFRWGHSGAKVFAEDYIATVASLRKSYKACKVIMACDSGSSSYRKNLLPGYKQGRKDKYELQTPAEEKAFFDFLEEFNRAIELMREIKDVIVLKYTKCEADDIAAYIVKKYSKSKCFWLISTDKDWDLLINDNVSRFSYVTRKEITVDNWNEHYEYDRDHHISIKCLTGDSGDSVPGVEGIGPKRAISLVNEFGSTYDIIANMPIVGKYKYISALNTFGAERLMLNYKLMDLLEFCDEALGAENCTDIDNKLEGFFNV
jgi:5'-3' exonuclease